MMMRFFTKPISVARPRAKQICYATRIERETPEELSMGTDDIYEITSDNPLNTDKDVEIKQLSDKLEKLNITFVKFNYSDPKDKYQHIPGLLIEKHELLKLKK